MIIIISVFSPIMWTLPNLGQNEIDMTPVPMPIYSESFQMTEPFSCSLVDKHSSYKQIKKHLTEINNSPAVTGLSHKNQ